MPMCTMPRAMKKKKKKIAIGGSNHASLQPFAYTVLISGYSAVIKKQHASSLSEILPTAQNGYSHFNFSKQASQSAVKPDMYATELPPKTLFTHLTYSEYSSLAQYSGAHQQTRIVNGAYEHTNLDGARNQPPSHKFDETFEN